MRTFWIIETECRDCYGYGYYDHPYRGESECPHCDGTGAVVHEEPADYYESVSDVRSDYPKARNIWKDTVS